MRKYRKEWKKEMNSRNDSGITSSKDEWHMTQWHNEWHWGYFQENAQGLVVNSKTTATAPVALFSSSSYFNARGFTVGTIAGVSPPIWNYTFYHQGYSLCLDFGDRIIQCCSILEVLVTANHWQNMSWLCAWNANCATLGSGWHWIRTRTMEHYD